MKRIVGGCYVAGINVLFSLERVARVLLRKALPD